MTQQTGALARRMERLIETALRPGRFISYSAGFAFVRELEAVEQRLSTCLPANPAQAVRLYETLLAGCYEKANEIDDSSGTFGDFVGQLHCRWIKTRQAAGANVDETATRVLAWIEADPYGFCHHLESDAAKVLNKAGTVMRSRRCSWPTASPKTDSVGWSVGSRSPSRRPTAQLRDTSLRR